jgi:hypothetical protein
MRPGGAATGMLIKRPTTEADPFGSLGGVHNMWRQRVSISVMLLVMAAPRVAYSQKPDPNSKKSSAELTDEGKDIIKDRELLENLELLQGFDKFRYFDLFAEKGLKKRKSPTDAIGIMLLTLLCALPVLHAQQSAVTPEAQWSRMSPEQQENLRERYQAFKKLSPEQQREVRDRLVQLRKIDRQDRAMIMGNYAGYQRLTPSQRLRLEQNYQRFKSLPRPAAAITRYLSQISTHEP